ncbi:ankyrin repeat and SAM domain-containing protein 4B [Paramisgurnus dabryanus]|uniref:ankyrin repeat and SAM domain-containing protein 4B n=1 Tax=Paramisgurnus dabryanus TaxID=90735 RepID=UPI0031F3505C
MSRYHKAAIDGYLDLLKEATRKDLNTPDEDGMTPTLWAAYHGRVEALQLICSRGGDPDKSDIWGNTPLHHAAANGHMQILSFLVNFGANLFALDNDFHTPMDVAASRDHMDCVRFLDSAASQQTSQNSKRVARLKDQATKDAERRVKLCERVKKKHQNKMEKMYRTSFSEPSFASSTGTISSVDSENFSKLITADANGSVKATLKGTLQHKFGKKDKGTITKQGDGNVIFVKQDSGSKEKPGFIDVFDELDEIDGDEDEERDTEKSDEEGAGQVSSIFARPGLGKMVFRRSFSMEMEPEDLPSGDTEDLGFLIRQEVFESVVEGEVFEEDSELPWNEEEIGLDEEDETSHLDSFLASISLVDFAPVFTREQLDLEALMLCSDDDLKSIRIQLGPRKKILEAAARRKAALKQCGVLKDTFL